jgi:hypothetical protein
MAKSTTEQQQHHYTPCAPLAALGMKFSQLGVFRPITEQVKIAQKVVKYTPVEKLVDALITILAGAHGLVEANKRVRPDRALQRAFGRDGCAEQSVISETLNASTPENVEHMQQAMKEIYQQHSAGYRHDYEQSLQLLDPDMTGQPCGRKAAFATKGYFAKQRNRRGRQLGRVLVTRYKEVVVDRIYDGKTQLPRAFQELVLAAEDMLDLDEEKRKRTILRMDGHGGSQGDVNWALERGYHIHTKEYSTDRARKLAETVVRWYDDPKIPGRQVGWVTVEPSEYVRPVKRIAVRTRKKNGQWGIGVLISTVPVEEIGLLARIPARKWQDPLAILLAYVYFYDLRGGGVETEIKEDKQGLGITNRNKKRFAAQQMMAQLNALAHNLIVWSRRWLAQTWNKVENLGILRMVRDVFHLSGLVHFRSDGSIERITLHQADPFASGLCAGLLPLLAPLHVAVSLGEI